MAKKARQARLDELRRKRAEAIQRYKAHEIASKECLHLLQDLDARIEREERRK